MTQPVVHGMVGRMNRRPRSSATCHPDRPLRSQGRCESCIRCNVAIGNLEHALAPAWRSYLREFESL